MKSQATGNVATPRYLTITLTEAEWCDLVGIVNAYADEYRISETACRACDAIESVITGVPVASVQSIASGEADEQDP